MRAVVITGSSTGIGRACAQTLDGMGFDVFAGVRRQEDGRSLRRAASGRLVPVHLDVAEFRRQLEVNLTGHLAVTQAFLPLLRRGRGRVVNISSVGGKLGDR